jgi:hypothetical protein
MVRWLSVERNEISVIGKVQNGPVNRAFSSFPFKVLSHPWKNSDKQLTVSRFISQRIIL